jgi:phosphatidylinositol glycan class A protein
MVVAMDYLVSFFLEWLYPAHTIERAQVFPYQKYRQFFEKKPNTDTDTNINNTTTHHHHHHRSNNNNNSVIKEEDEEENK